MDHNSPRMGACISCFKRLDHDEDFNENSSLLRNQYNEDYLQEAEAIKQQQRQQELGVIVNDLSDSLIDVSSFITSGGTVFPVINPNFITLDEAASQCEMRADLDNSTYPRQYTTEELQQVLQKVEKLCPMTRMQCKVDFKDKLYVEL